MRSHEYDGSIGTNLDTPLFWLTPRLTALVGIVLFDKLLVKPEG